jgi:zinc transport system ATP-binding protein
MIHAAIFENVSQRYESYHVLEDVSFTLEKGAITTLIGPNGAGKTTIARLLLKLENPTSGLVKNTLDKQAYVPQKLSINRELPLTVLGFIELLSPNRKLSAISGKLMDFCNIETLKNESVYNISGGQLQRLMLASAILNAPQLLVLDEPTQGLDIEAQEEFYSILEELKNLNETTIFLISHDLFTVMKKSDQVLCLNHHLCCRGRPTHTVVKGAENIGIYAHKHDHKHG